MGVYDSIKATLVCTTCQNTEVATAVDGGPFHWNDFRKVKDFDLASVFTGDGNEEPGIVSVTCKRCGTAVNVTYQYQV